MAKILKTSTGKIIKTTAEKIVVSEGSTPTPQLDAPVISASGKVISWSAVQNATSYVINSSYIGEITTTSTSYDLTLTDEWWSTVWPGDTVSVTVKAKAAGYIDSQASNSVSVRKEHGRTWVINRHPDISTAHYFEINFKAYNPFANATELFDGIEIMPNYPDAIVYMHGTGLTVYSGYDEYDWDNDYELERLNTMVSRIIVFQSEPTGDLLTWLLNNTEEHPCDFSTYIINENITFSSSSITSSDIEFASPGTGSYDYYQSFYLQNNLRYYYTATRYTTIAQTIGTETRWGTTSDLYSEYAGRVVTFKTVPTGNLATWLQDNAVLQNNY